jgi:hypothetical protein
MVKPRRIIVSKGYYHLYNRFVSGLSLFNNKETVKIFWDEFLKYSDEFGVNVFILYNMPNHFHSFIQITENNLSEFIQKYSTNFARKVNKVTKRKGHVFQGRHKTQLVDTDRYLYVLIHYIFNNAKRAGIVEKVEDFKWSNLDDIINNYSTNPNYKWLIEQILPDKKNVCDKFLKWLNQSLTNKNEKNIIKKIEGQFLMDNLKKEIVLEKIDRRITAEKSDESKKRKNEIRDFKNLNNELKKQINEILENEINKYELYWKSDIIAKQHILWYCLRKIFHLKLKEICELNSIYRHQTISQALIRIDNNINKKNFIKKIIKKLKI